MMTNPLPPERLAEIKAQAEIKRLRTVLSQLADPQNYEIENRSHEWDTCDHHIQWDSNGPIGDPETPWEFARRALDGQP